MCEMAPAIIYLFDRMGVPFSRTKEGLLDFRRFGGTKHHRTAFAGASTGQQLLYALDEQVRRYESVGADQLVFGLPIDMPWSAAMETVRLFGEHVIPKMDPDPAHRTTRFRDAAAARA